MKKTLREMFTKITATTLVIVLACLAIGLSFPHPPTFAQANASNVNVFMPNSVYPAMTFTATSQTLKQAIGGKSYCTLSGTAVALTTATFQVKLSNDNGANYYAASVAPYAASLTPVTTAFAVTSAPALYVFNAASFTSVEIVSSGTFTATSFSWQLTCSTNRGLL